MKLKPHKNAWDGVVEQSEKDYHHFNTSVNWYIRKYWYKHKVSGRSKARIWAAHFVSCWSEIETTDHAGRSPWLLYLSIIHGQFVQTQIAWEPGGYQQLTRSSLITSRLVTATAIWRESRLKGIQTLDYKSVRPWRETSDQFHAVAVAAPGMCILIWDIFSSSAKQWWSIKQRRNFWRNK